MSVRDPAQFSLLHERRNRLVHIYRLPPETLGCIFTWLVDIDPAKLTAPVRLGWIVVSHICRRWRAVALDCPSLWTRHSMDDDKRWWTLFLKRDRGLPVDVDGSVWNDLALSRIVFIRNAQRRVRNLRLYKIPRRRDNVLHLAGPLPKLQVLHLQYDDAAQGSFEVFESDIIKVAPKLKELKLDGVAFPWAFGSSTLTMLDIANSLHTLPRDFPYTLLDVARTLRQMPGLRVLALVNALPAYAPGTQNTKMNPISLPHLEKLCLVSEHVSCWYLWSWMTVQAPHTEIRCTSRVDDHSLITPPVHANIRALSDSLYTYAHIHISSRSSKLKLSLQDAIYAWKDKRLLRRSLSLTAPCVDPARLTGALFDTQLKDDITHLQLSGSFRDHKLFQAAFEPMHAVEMLYLGNNMAEAALAAMHRAPALFPAAGTLYCRAVDFGRVAGHKVRLHDVLRDVLYGTERVIPKLRVSQCDVRKKWVDKWRGVADEVDWDGDEGKYKAPLVSSY